MIMLKQLLAHDTDKYSWTSTFDHRKRPAPILACSQILYFLLKVRRARVIKIKTAGN